jgi:protein TonB
MLLAIGLSLGIHGLLLGMEFSGSQTKSPGRLKSRVLSMALTYHHPEKRALETAVENIEAQPEKTVPIKKKRVTPPRTIPPQTEKTNIPKVRDEDRLTPESTVQLPPEDSEVPEGPSEGMSVPDKLSGGGGAEPGIPGSAILREATPLYRINKPPPYPGTARRRGYHGTVLLEVLVGRQGKVSDLRVLTSSGYAVLDKAAMESVGEWVFEPGMRGDEKVEMWVRVPIRFELE